MTNAQKRNAITVGIWTCYGLLTAIAGKTDNALLAIPIALVGFYAALRTMGEA